MKTMTLEFAGIYFRRKLEVELPSNDPTVQEVMDAFQSVTGDLSNVGGFDYHFDLSTPNPMKSITHNYGGGVSRSGKTKDAGIYKLTELVVPDANTVYAWQYYVLDAKNKRVSAAKVTGIDPVTGEYHYQGKFEPFTDARFEFDDDWTITWRLVGIVRQPNA